MATSKTDQIEVERYFNKYIKQEHKNKIFDPDKVFKKFDGTLVYNFEDVNITISKVVTVSIYKKIIHTEVRDKELETPRYTPGIQI